MDMPNNLDNWIKDAKDKAPDSGEYRRLNRALLKDKMAAAEGRRSRRHRVLLGSLSLVFLILLSGQLNQLGSDSFDTTTSTIIHPWSRDTVTVQETHFRGSVVNLPEDFSEADIDEFFRSIAAGEGEVLKVFGISYGGKTLWTKYVRRIIEGKENLGGEPVIDPKSDSPDKLEDFYIAYSKDLVAQTKTDPPHGRTRMMVDGILVDFKTWTYEYPGFGEVTRYVGTPVE